MVDSFLSSNGIVKTIASSATREKPLIELEIRTDGFNQDFAQIYDWHLNFPFYTGKGYRALKLEDYHYYSESSQFGQGVRQTKGGSIRAFQENLQQLIQLVKVNLMPLLKEVKEADFYKTWFDKIVNNDKIVQDLLKKKISNDDSILKKARNERNEAIRHIKDKWVSDVDGSKMWQLNRSAAEQGQDMVLLPQLFFGINLDNPLVDYHGLGKTIKEQLDDDIYPISISEDAKSIVAGFMFRFHSWLPTAIKDTNISFKIKIATLKQFYTQLQMYINFMKPLLLEISRKSEGFDKNNFYRDFEAENPEFADMFDNSYSFIRILGIRNLDIRGKHKLKDLELTKFGLYLKEKSDIIGGEGKGKTGFIKREIKNQYEFYETNNRNILKEEFDKIKPIMINKRDLKPFPVMEYEFLQKRRNETVKTEQGSQQLPFMKNGIIYKGFCWNLFEIATYRETLKEDNLDLLESFISEIKIVKDDLLYYVNDLEANKKEDFTIKSNENLNKKENKSETEDDFSLILGPFKALWFLISPFKLIFKKSNTSSKSYSSNTSKVYNQTRISIIDDTWKIYSVNKKIQRLIQY